MSLTIIPGVFLGPDGYIGELKGVRKSNRHISTVVDNHLEKRKVLIIIALPTLINVSDCYNCEYLYDALLQECLIYCKYLREIFSCCIKFFPFSTEQRWQIRLS